MALDVERARCAIEERCARPLGRDVVEVANGIVEIANAAMINALRLVSVQRGYDPRDFALVAFGGAGPAHANRLAAELQIPRLIIPPAPGIFSAMGLLVTELKHDYAVTRICRTDRLDLAEVAALFDRQMAEGQAMLAREGMSSERTSFRRSVDMRYVGQSFELTIAVPPGAIDDRAIATIVEQFHTEHRRAFGHSTPGEPTEFVNLRVTALGMITKPAMREIAPHCSSSTASAVQECRPVYFAEAGGFVECPIVVRYKLGAGAIVDGPAIVEEMDSTTVLHPGYRATIDRYGDLLIEPAGS
jgi:N-methylhydantoinase A